MDQQVAWGGGKLGNEDRLLSMQASTETYFGRLNKARDFSRRAVDSAIRNDSREKAALWRVMAACQEAEIGNQRLAKKEVTAALAASSGRDVKIWSILTLARSGDALRAKTLAEDLEKNNPTSTMVNIY